MRSSCILVSSFAFAYPKISEEIHGARFSSNGLWPDKNWASKEDQKGFKYLGGYWDIQKVDIDEVKKGPIIHFNHIFRFFLIIRPQQKMKSSIFALIKPHVMRITSLQNQ